jgi:hypothetical protein
MGWERGYYYRTRKVNGRVMREYVGAGRVAELAAELDRIGRERRQLNVLQQRQEKAQLAELDATVKRLDEAADLLAHAALLATGFHQHNRGEWRKKRG